ncbi:MAG: DNA-3-methyladenine glycosylase [Gemmatimonadota bacterium]
MTIDKRAAKVLPVSFFARSAEIVARELLGAVVVSRSGGVRTAGRIVETEAYLGGPDPASHGYQLRQTPRNRALFGPPGTWYVYRSYGIHWCTNLVCQSNGSGSAVLLRALEPMDGIETMRHRRGVIAERLLCSGPGRLCQALGITRDLDGTAMRVSEVLVREGALERADVVSVSTRIGITKAADWPLRFLLSSSVHVSRPIPRSPASSKAMKKRGG